MWHQKYKQQQSKIDSLGITKINTFCDSKSVIKDVKTAHRIGENISKSYVFKELLPLCIVEYKKEIYNPAIKRTQLKMGKGSKQTFLQKRYMNDQ